MDTYKQPFHVRDYHDISRELAEQIREAEPFKVSVCKHFNDYICLCDGTECLHRCDNFEEKGGEI